MTIKKSIKILKIVKDHKNMKKIVKIRRDQISSTKYSHCSIQKMAECKDARQFSVQLPVSSLTLSQLEYQLEIRGMKAVGSQSEIMQQLVSVLSSCGPKEPDSVSNLDIQCLQYDIDAYISAAKTSVSLSQFYTLLAIVREPAVFGEGRMLAISALAHNVWSAMALKCEKSRTDFIDVLEEPDQTDYGHTCDEAAMEMRLSSIALRLDRVQFLRKADPTVAEKFRFLQNAMKECCRRTTARPPAMKLQEYPRLLQPLKNCTDPPVSTILPFLIALRNAGVVDGTLGCGASPAERVEADRLEVLFGAWVDRNPWAQEFLDSPYTVVIPVATEPRFQTST